MNLGQRSFGPASVRVTHYRPDVDDELTEVERERLRDVQKVCRLLSHVEVSPTARGQGHATRMLKRLFTEADQAQLSLVLEPRPFSDGPMDRNLLESWYTRLGFTRFQDEPCLMVRLPRQ